mmetsp:Transcript_157/g.426  ORF Transcript_157/g.426 Transcript_157/m.426 type:complete len:222 (-) Transcript_157:823-1488(-)
MDRRLRAEDSGTATQSSYRSGIAASSKRAYCSRRICCVMACAMKVASHCVLADPRCSKTGSHGKFCGNVGGNIITIALSCCESWNGICARAAGSAVGDASQTAQSMEPEGSWSRHTRSETCVPTTTPFVESTAALSNVVVPSPWPVGCKLGLTATPPLPTSPACISCFDGELELFPPAIGLRSAALCVVLPLTCLPKPRNSKPFRTTGGIMRLPCMSAHSA